LKASSIAAGAAALTLAGCGGKDKPAVGGTPTPEGTPQPGGDDVIGLSDDPEGLDPATCLACYWVAGQFHGYLYSVNVDDQTAMLQMAASFERPDDLTYVWQLRPGIKFHNVDPVWGREVSAEDVVYSFSRIRDNPAVIADKQLLSKFTATLEATDKYTCRLVTNQPFSPTFRTIDSSAYAIVPREAVEKWGDLQQNSVGCGAFILEDYVRGERVKMIKNPEFYMPGRPFLNSIEWVVIPDESTLLEAFRTGQHDETTADLDKLKVQELQKNEHIVVREEPNYWTRAFLLKVDTPPFDDPRVREAIDLAVDRQDLIDKMAFGEGKFNGPVTPSLEDWALPQEELREFYKVDLNRAKQLLVASGFGDGFDLDLPVMEAVDIAKVATVVKEHLAKIGVRCNIQPKSTGVYLAQHLLTGNFQATMYYSLPYTDPDAGLLQWFSKGQSGVSFSGYNNPVMDDWIWKTRAEIDSEKRRALVLDAQRAMLNEHGPFINLYTPKKWEAWWDWVHKLESERMGTWRYLGIEVWMTK
jgi:peptide/nickel transport system substrate-binding protein